MTKIKLAEPDDPQTPPEAEETVDTDYELMAYSSTKIDYEYIINLIQNIVTPMKMQRRLHRKNVRNRLMK